MEKRTVSAEEWKVDLTSYEEARSRIIAMVGANPAVYVPVKDALGCVSAKNIAAPTSVPPFDNSAMDGYAVDSRSVSEGSEIDVSELKHISTGMPLPAGTDAIVPWEHTRSSGATVHFEQAIQAGQYVRAAGNDIAAGDIVVPAGSRLGPVRLGALSSVGLQDVLVHRRPRVSVLVTGEELATPGTNLGDAHVFDVNSTMLPALLRSAGADVVAVERCTDDRDLIAKTINDLCKGSDLVVTTGGASVGERDWVRTILEDDGELTVWRVAVRPGKPVAAGFINDTPLVVLPGNPGSVLACTHGFVVPLLRKFQGSDPQPKRASYVLAADLVNDQDRVFLCPVTLDNGVATPLIGATSQGLHHALDVAGFVVAPPGSQAKAGAQVNVEYMV